MSRIVRLSGYELPHELLDQDAPLCVAVAGGGVPASTFDNLGGVRADVTICQLDYLTGPGPWSIQAVSASLIAQLSRRSGATFLVGHSLGSAICLLTAAGLGDALTGLYVCDSGLSTARHRNQELTQRIAAEGWTYELATQFVRTFTRDPLSDDETEALVAFCLAVGAEAMTEATGSLRSTDLSVVAASITAPTIIGHGIDDARRPLEDARAMRDAIPGARLHLFDCGHTPMVEAAREHADLLTALIAEGGC